MTKIHTTYSASNCAFICEKSQRCDHFVFCRPSLCYMYSSSNSSCQIFGLESEVCFSYQSYSLMLNGTTCPKNFGESSTAAVPNLTLSINQTTVFESGNGYERFSKEGSEWKKWIEYPCGGGNDCVNGVREEFIAHYKWYSNAKQSAKDAQSTCSAENGNLFDNFDWTPDQLHSLGICFFILNMLSK